MKKFIFTLLLLSVSVIGHTKDLKNYVEGKPLINAGINPENRMVGTYNNKEWFYISESVYQQWKNKSNDTKPTPEQSSPTSKDVIIPWEQDSIAIEGNVLTKSTDWLKKWVSAPGIYHYKLGVNYTGVYYSEAASCGHNIDYLANYPNEIKDHLKELEARSFECKMAILGINFAKNLLQVKIDLWRDGILFSTYIAGLQSHHKVLGGEIKSLLNENKTNNVKLDTLTDAVTALSRDHGEIFQSKYRNGYIAVTKLSSLSINPLEDSRLLPYYKVTNILSGSDNTWEEVFDSTPLHTFIYFDSQYGLNKKFDSIDSLFDAVKGSISVIRDAEKKLIINSVGSSESSVDGVDEFKETIESNSELISKEFREVRRLLNVSNYHPMEMMYFVNKMSNFVKSVDSLLEEFKSGGRSNLKLTDIIKQQ